MPYLHYDEGLWFTRLIRGTTSFNRLLSGADSGGDAPGARPTPLKKKKKEKREREEERREEARRKRYVQ